MIVSFADKHTEKVWKGESAGKWHPDIQRIALRKLFLIHAAATIQDLVVPPGNKLHKLKGEKKDYWAIRVNDQWRITFKWINDGAYDVQLLDYH